MTRVGKRANIEAVNMNELIHVLQNLARMRIRLRIYRYVLTWENSVPWQRAALAAKLTVIPVSKTTTYHTCTRTSFR